jgi:hypothetical protein
MKDPEYYQRAFDDPAFCREKIDSLRHSKKVEIGLMIFCLAGLITTIVHAVLSGRIWDVDEGWLALLTVNGGVYAATVTRLAALEVIAQRTASSVPSAATGTTVRGAK